MRVIRSRSLHGGAAGVESGGSWPGASEVRSGQMIWYHDTLIQPSYSNSAEMWSHVLEPLRNLKAE